MRTTVLLLDADLLVRDTVEAMLTAINCAVVPVPDWYRHGRLNSHLF